VTSTEAYLNLLSDNIIDVYPTYDDLELRFLAVIENEFTNDPEMNSSLRDELISSIQVRQPFAFLYDQNLHEDAKQSLIDASMGGTAAYATSLGQYYRAAGQQILAKTISTNPGGMMRLTTAARVTFEEVTLGTPANQTLPQAAFMGKVLAKLILPLAITTAAVQIAKVHQTGGDPFDAAFKETLAIGSGALVGIAASAVLATTFSPIALAIVSAIAGGMVSSFISQHIPDLETIVPNALLNGRTVPEAVGDAFVALGSEIDNFIDATEETAESVIETGEAILTDIDSYIGNASDSINDLSSAFLAAISQFDLLRIQRDPLIVDLNGDGHATVTGDGVYFDLDADGNFAEATLDWVAPTDGMIVIDANANNRADDGSEILSASNVNAWTQLRAFDSNNDNAITSADTAWSQIHIWQDKNTDGYTQADEWFDLADLNITSINIPASGNVGSITTMAGSLRTDAVVFGSDPRNTRFNGDVEIDFATLFLPQLAGYNALPDLRAAMSLDNTGTGNLLDSVSGLATTPLSDVFDDLPSFYSDFKDMLFRWAGVDGINPASRGQYLDDARKIEFFEEYFGSEFTQIRWPDNNPLSLAANTLMNLFAVVTEPMLARLLFQMGAGSLFETPGRYDRATDSIVFDSTPVLDADALLSLGQDGANAADPEAYWASIAFFIRSVRGSLDGFTTAELTALDVAVAASDSSLDWDAIDKAFSFIGLPVTLDGTGSADFLVGGTGSDTLTGLGGDDTLQGNAGADVLDGGDGNDLLQGGDGHDHLIGGAGNDTLRDGSGSDLLEGGAGDDIYVWEGGADDYIADTGGSDALRLNSTSVSPSSVFFERVFGTDLQIRYNGSLITLENQLNGGIGIDRIEELQDLNGNLLFDLTNITAIVTTKGTGGDDVLTGIEFGTSRNDLLMGGAGNDTLLGGFGSDSLNGEDGADELYGGSGDDALNGGLGADSLYGGDGNDILTSDEAPQYNDHKAYDDYLEGGAGDDVAIGNAGNDTYFYTSGHDTYNDKSGNDVVELSADWLSTDVSIFRQITGTTGQNNLTIELDANNSILLQDFFFTSSPPFGFSVDGKFETLRFNDSTADLALVSGTYTTYGSNHADTITDIGNDTVYAGDGNDTVGTTLSSSGDDTYYAEGGDDLISTSDGSDTVYGGAGNDTIRAALASDISGHLYHGGAVSLALSGDGSDSVDYSWKSWGTSYGLYVDLSDPEAGFAQKIMLSNSTLTGAQDTLISIENITGTAYADTLIGNDSVNILDGRDGNDTLLGGNGNDIYVLSNGQDIASDTGGTGDIIRLPGSISFDTLTFAQSGNDLVISRGANSLTITDFYNGKAVEWLEIDGGVLLDLTARASWVYGTSSAETLNGGSGNDTVLGLAGDDTLNGSDGNDSIIGGGGADTIHGDSGADTISGGAGDDTLYGDDGDDVISGDAGGDTIYGGAGADTITSGNGANYVWGGAGNDHLTGGGENDYLNGEGGDDFIEGGDGADSIVGGNDNDTLYGGAGNDNIGGDAGNDIIDGGAGLDTILGGDGDDIIIGAPTRDTVNGGAGFDTVDYSALSTRIIVDGSLVKPDGTSDNALTTPLTNVEKIIGTSFNDEFYAPTDSSSNVYVGGAGNDTFNGRAGNDTLEGGSGNDTYIYEATSHGEDSVSDSSGGRDVIQFGAGILASNIILTNAGDDLEITFSGVSGAKITILGQNAAGTAQIELLRFADNSIVELVAPTNPAPIAQNDVFLTTEGETRTGNVLADNGNGADSDSDGSTLNVTAGSFTTAEGGTVTLQSDGTFAYTSALGFSGVDSFDYTVTDADGGSDIGTATITVAALSNRNPTAQADLHALLRDQRLTGNLLADNGNGADSDIDGDTLSVARATLGTAQGGLVTIQSNGDFEYVPPAGFTGSDSFEYTVMDTQGGDARATVTVSVSAPNEAPDARNDAFTGASNHTVAGNLLSDNGSGADSDPDADDLEVVATTLTTAAGATVVLLANGNFTYTPATNFVGTDSFHYVLLDSEENADVGTVTLTVQQNQAPNTQDDEAEGDEDTVITGNVLADNGNGPDTDAENDTLAVQAASFTTSNGGNVVLLANGDFTYTPAANFNGTDSFEYTVLDGHGGSTEGTVQVTVSPVNDLPSLTNNGASFDQDTTLTITAAMLTASDVESSAASLTFTLDSAPSHGAVKRNGVTLVVNDSFSAQDVANGLVTYVPPAGYSGSDSFGFVLGDGTATLSPASFAITVNSTVNTINGTSGNDTLNGTSGNDLINGLAGNDTINTGDGTDTVYAGSGDDTINSASYTYAGAKTIYGEDGVDSINGGAGNDTIYGGIGNDSLSGHSGNDTLYGGDGTDYIHGEAGDDTLHGDAGDDYLYGHIGYDILYGGAGNDTLYGAHSVSQSVLNSIYGTHPASTKEIYGGDGTDTLYGYVGNDLLAGGTGADTAYGGAGDDTYYFNVGDGFDTISDDSGSVDKIVFGTGISPANLIFTNTGTYNVEITFAGTSTDKITILNQRNGSSYRIEKLVFPGNIELDFPIYGTSSANTLSGTTGNDLIYGYGGNDSITSNNGDDIVYAGDGDDTINSASYTYTGNKVLHGEGGADSINGGAGNDTIYGGSGIDSISGHAGNDTIYGGDDGDYVHGEAGDDVLHGDGGNDYLYGHIGYDILYGGAGNDTLYGAHSVSQSVLNSIYGTHPASTKELYGGDGADTLYGYVGNDILSGDAGADTMTGGAGSDTFRFEDATAYSAVDTILDFSKTEGDKIDLANLLEGYDPQQHLINDFVSLTTSGGNTTVRVDKDGTGSSFSAQSVVTINGQTWSSVSDMITNGHLVVQD